MMENKTQKPKEEKLDFYKPIRCVLNKQHLKIHDTWRVAYNKLSKIYTLCGSDNSEDDILRFYLNRVMDALDKFEQKFLLHIKKLKKKNEYVINI